ncbi:MAG: class I SAM-dependent methyltransferase [Bacteroidota bacterium]
MKDLLKQLSFRAFRLASRVGFFVAPVHYYVPLANFHELKRTKPVWARRSDLPGVTSSLDKQASRLQEICIPFREEYTGNITYHEAVNRHFGPGYGYIEAQALHGVVRHYKPLRVIEVGSGVSTLCMLRALELNEQETGQPFALTCIEPYPSNALRALDRIRLVESPVQTCSMEMFEELGSGDLLFIDSSHAVRPGGDVNYLILEVLPRLSPGVVIHFHDIYLPYDYPRDVLKTYFQWMETSLLRAYLIHNNRARILFCLSQLHYDRHEALTEAFPEYVPAPDDNGLETTGRGHFPASIYIRTE